jgi:4'-phosphopantetheinyl transferase EntD
LTHDGEIAAAIVGSAGDFDGLGIDIEPALPLPRDLIPLVATPRETRLYSGTDLSSRLFFVIKEATYKATSGHEPYPLDFQDIEVDLANSEALTSGGLMVGLSYCTYPRTIAIAVLSSGRAYSEIRTRRERRVDLRQPKRWGPHGK